MSNDTCNSSLLAASGTVDLGIEASAIPSFEITLFTNEHGNPLTKGYYIDREGQVRPQSAAQMARGTAERVTISTLADFAALIENMRHDQCLSLGVLKPGLPNKVNIVTAKELARLRTAGKAPANTVTRTLAHMDYPAPGTPAAVVLDSDPKGIPTEVEDAILSVSGTTMGVWGAVCAVVPGLIDAAVITRSSTSAGIYRTDRPDNPAVPGGRGVHHYVVIKDARDTERFLTVLHKRMVLSGLGWGGVAADGKFLERSPVDPKVYGPERQIFEGSPVLTRGLEQQPRKAYVTPGVVIDSRAVCPDLTPNQEKRYQEIVADIRERMKPELEAQAALYKQTNEDALVKRGVSPDRARKVVEESAKQVLLSEFVLPFDNKKFEGHTVGQVLANPSLYYGEAMMDPIDSTAEPGPFVDHGAGKAIIMEKKESHTPFIHSFVHGGRIYELKASPEAAFEAEQPEQEEAEGVWDDVGPEPEASAEPLEERHKLWFKELVTDKHGVISNLSNIALALRKAPSFEGVLAWNEFAVTVDIVGRPPWVGAEEPFEPHHMMDVEISHLRAWLQTYGITKAGKGDVREALSIEAHRNKFHPVRDYLDGLKWDGVPRLDAWLVDHMGVLDSQLHRAMGSKFLIGCVARIYEPGCQMDCMLILESVQGRRKSTAIQLLAGTAWFTDNMPEIGNKDAMIQLQGKWIIEMGELEAFGKADERRLKRFLTTKHDRFRPPFGITSQDHPRQCGFFGTINPDGNGYLKDTTGARRYWTIECCVDWDEGRRIDLQRLAAARDQIWAEAVVRYKSGEIWYLESVDLEREAAAAADERYTPDVWTDKVLAFLADKESVTTTEVLERCIYPKGTPGDWKRGDSMAVGGILRKHGWDRKKDSTGKRSWRYWRPASWAPVPKLPAEKPEAKDNVVDMEARRSALKGLFT